MTAKDAYVFLTCCRLSWKSLVWTTDSVHKNRAATTCLKIGVLLAVLGSELPVFNCYKWQRTFRKFFDKN
jgi:hypothetical protein